MTAAEKPVPFQNKAAGEAEELATLGAGTAEEGTDGLAALGNCARGKDDSGDGADVLPALGADALGFNAFGIDFFESEADDLTALCADSIDREEDLPADDILPGEEDGAGPLSPEENARRRHRAAAVFLLSVVLCTVALLCTYPIPGGGPGAPDMTPEEVSRALLLDLNTATAPQLEALPGIGPKTAAAIVAYREEAGGFSSVEELLLVPGIGEAAFAQGAQYLYVGQK